MNTPELLRSLMRHGGLPSERGTWQDYVQHHVGRAWATTGHVLVSVPSVEPVEPSMPDDVPPPNKWTLGHVASYLQAMDTEAVVAVSAIALRAAVADAIETCRVCNGRRRTTCTMCSGAGSHECCCGNGGEHDCHRCGGDGSVPCCLTGMQSAALLRFGPALVNPVLLVPLAAHLVGAVRVWWTTEKAAVLLRTEEDVRIVLMPWHENGGRVVVVVEGR